MKKMSRPVCFVDTNKVNITGRLFVKLSNGEVFYFGNNVKLLDSNEIRPYCLFFKRAGDGENNVYRKLEIVNVDDHIDIIESIYSNNVNTTKAIGMYRYFLSILLRNTEDANVDNRSYWGEYRALKERPILMPTFPDYAMKLEDKQK